MSRFVQPGSEKLEISDGDWLIVKRELTAGEARRAFARTVKRMNAGDQTELDPEGVGLGKMVAYLLDWSLVGHDGKPVVIRDQPDAVIEAALLSLDTASFLEIFNAINAHERAETARALEEKKRQSGANRPLAILRSAE